MNVRASGRGLRVAAVAAETGTVLLAAGAFVLSFTALHDLAARSGIDADLAWLWPLIVDGLIVVATVAVFALAGTRAVWYPWLLLAGGAGVSVTANALHALVTADPAVPPLLAASVASVPPVVLVASTHLTAILIRHSRTALVSAPTELHPEHSPALTPAASPQLPPSPDPQAPEPEPSTPTALGMRLSPQTPNLTPTGSLPVPEEPLLELVEADGRRPLAAQLREVGLNNAQIARLFGVDRSTVGRWLAKPVEEAQEVAS